MNDSAPAVSYRVSVRELCEFTAKAGDLDLRFTPAPSAQEGIAGHAKVAARRGPGYERELALGEDFAILQVRGRADGYRADRHELEEIKTFRGAFERIPANHRALHWAQLKVYGAMLCRQKNLAELRLTLVYFDILREQETPLSEVHDAASLRAFFEDHCRRFLDWAQQQSAHRQRRNAQLATLRFPFENFHAGQRRLAEAAYRRGRDGGALMVQAPTGIGKTMGTLFPTLKACARGEIDKIFFLTAKTPGRQLALDAAGRIRNGAPEPALRVLELTARDKACVHPDKACHGESCPLAKGFYDRLPQARQAALASAPIDQGGLRSVALEHAVCPYYLGQELARWADLIVGDYNYYFDTSALLHALAQANGWKTALLVDEAHNLIERGRAMYSAELDQNALAAIRASAPPVLKTPLERLNREWNRIHRDQEADYQTYEAPPQAFVDALAKLNTALGEHFGEHPEQIDPRLQEFHFACLHWRAMADVFAAHSIFDVSLQRGRTRAVRSRLCLRNVVPAPFLRPRFDDAHSALLFSATLAPADFYRGMLGLDDSTATLDVASPFSAEQLSVQILDTVSTRYQHRPDSIGPIVERIATQYRSRPGNYLAFFSSFDYLHAVAAGLSAAHPEVPAWQQVRSMSEAEREAFLHRFQPQGRGIGFAVLGGAFAEGIDLPGSRLIGAFIATLGLPQLNPVNEQMKARLEALFGRGYEYTYLYPGLQKVVQAAGRIIRGIEDRGTLLLIDDRYRRPAVRALLPAWWQLDRRTQRPEIRDRSGAGDTHPPIGP